MIMMTFHGQHFDLVLLTDGQDQLLKAVFHTRNIEYLSAVSGTKHEVIVDQGYSCIGMSIRCIHMYNITFIIHFDKQKKAAFIPRLKWWAFPPRIL